MKTIWVLFSIYNDYNQPYHNLSAWWVNKPSAEDLLKIATFTKEKIDIIFDGGSTASCDGGAEYRLREIPEGEVTEKY